MSPTEALQKAREFLADPARWTRRTYRNTSTNQCCLAGAVRLAVGFYETDNENWDHEAYYKAIERLNACMPGALSITSFNDSYYTTHEEILKALDCAIQKEDAK